MKSLRQEEGGLPRRGPGAGLLLLRAHARGLLRG
jgi:hypothetical protein